jgi:pimeloyl-ACP methyl ester carboxylesterase
MTLGEQPVPGRGGHLWDKDRTAEAADGTLVRYTVLGPEGAPWVVLCAGFLCPDNFWLHLGPDLARDHRVLVLNYRGIGASSEARGGRRPTTVDDYTIPALATDVEAVLDAEGVTNATVLGHSMGVQVALALWHARPDLVAALALIAGPYASPFATMYGSNLGTAVFPLVSIGLPLVPLPASRRLMRSLELPIAMPFARAIRALGPNTPVDDMRLYRSHMGNIDPRTAIWTARGMHRFDADPWLDRIDVPTVVVVGDADTWTPEPVARTLVDRIAGARLLVVPGGSHTLPIEFPDQVIRGVRMLEPT